MFRFFGDPPDYKLIFTIPSPFSWQYLPVNKSIFTI